MSGSRAGRALVVLVPALTALALAQACRSEPEICTPESAGVGGQRLVRRDLPGRDPKEPCNPHVEIIRSLGDLKLAYAKAGVPVAGTGRDAGAEAVTIPPIDFSKETVVIREESHTKPASWLAASGDKVTIGSQGCFGATDDRCSFEVFAINAIVAKTEAYSCESIACSGAAVGAAGGGGE